ncbi:glycosyltransferase family 4 protein [Candidatus Peregrinibacteria bacterium]|nr:glycosyltransferase family 4 protein [Candidatus Peregrinibacteria bacterium]
MRILMLGWEFPPFYSGGLGVASKSIAEAIASHGINVTFAIPYFVFDKVRKNDLGNLPFELVSGKLESFTWYSVPTAIKSPYISEDEYATVFEDAGVSSGFHMYGASLFAEIERYAQEMEKFVEGKHFDIIHAHDWITFHAARRIKKRLGIPFIAHVHATEFDRTGNHPNQAIYDMERESLEDAEKIIAVSNYTKGILMAHYGIPGEKIEVVHNGREEIQTSRDRILHREKKTVLFLGRLTLQKGPDWFVKIAEKVLSYRKDVEFIIGGTGDMMGKILNEILQKGLQENVFCLGFLGEEDREYAFASADVYVMPSVSEPFGLSAVEAAQRGIPVILSHQSGAKEVISHSLCADFWDIEKMANHILAVLEYSPLSKMLSEKSGQEVARLSWKEQVKKIIQMYHSFVM